MMVPEPLGIFCNIYFFALLAFTVWPVFLWEMYWWTYRSMTGTYRILRQPDSGSWNQMRMRSNGPPAPSTEVRDLTREIERTSWVNTMTMFDDEWND